MSDMPPPPSDDIEWPVPAPERPDVPYGIAQKRRGVVTLESGRPVELAGRGLRLAARILDLLAVVVLAFTFGLLTGIIFALAGASSETSVVPIALISVVFAVCGYEVLFTALRGQTVGKAMVGIMVVRSDGSVPGLRKAFGRWVVVHLVPIAAPLVYLSLTWDARRQGWHDKAAGTLVVKVQ